MLEQIKILRELTLPSILLRIFLSMLFSGILGYEREKKHRPAGFRTYIIVCLGSTLAMMTGLYISALTGSSDPARIPAQAISGIGFLGAGTILVTRQNRVRGLTTAAGLWAVACLGLSLGAGFYTGALIFFTAIWVSIWILRFVDNRLTDHLKAVHLYVEFSNIEYISKFLSLAREQNCTVNNLEISRTENDKKEASLSATMTMHFREAVAYSQIIETYGSLEGVIFIRKND
ncbi:MgtC/SapB family protein [Parablautia intestinalis]|jgi:putative Mg2+ transporter-C (MgtC) family protein|uniref:MgtC/SapB family protein n=1 Tax=Parablautia intestinalis TaxID=2320100 RepID=UPI0023C5988C|nr:MgtC/SapB family protein [Parablautia intestinalis]MCI8615012.1 MgtC/SapB family protein [Lachnospiraceae bacterium]MDE7047199.1 MgtC/SapB family protein [Lachnospiraceae bacterium]